MSPYSRNTLQKTVNKNIVMEGVSITGKFSKTKIKPAPENHGIVFKRVDIVGQPNIEASFENVEYISRFGITITKNNYSVSYIEMILAALFGLQVDNVLIEIDCEHMPIYDGSAIFFVNEINKIGIKKQKAKKKVYKINEILIGDDNNFVVMPLNNLDITIMFAFGMNILGSQFATMNLETNFVKEIAPARTHMFLGELLLLLESNLIKTNNLKNSIIFVDQFVSSENLKLLVTFFKSDKIKISPQGHLLVYNKYDELQTADLRFVNEVSRHKLLYSLSFLALFGGKILGKFYITKPTIEKYTYFFKKIHKVLMIKKYEYDIALSFAGENRIYVEKVAKFLKKNNISVFYDKYEQVNLWGKDLYQHLNNVYKNKSQFCVVFVSEFYAKKLWTNHELKSAQERAFNENKEYILPVRFDETIIPGLNSTTGYINLNNVSEKGLSEMIINKLKMEG